MLTQTTVPLHEGPLNSKGYPDRSSMWDLILSTWTYLCFDYSSRLGVIAVTNDMIQSSKIILFIRYSIEYKIMVPSSPHYVSSHDYLSSVLRLNEPLFSLTIRNSPTFPEEVISLIAFRIKELNDLLDCWQPKLHHSSSHFDHKLARPPSFKSFGPL